MRLFYHLLGASAKANETLWWLRGNFVPLNVVGIIILIGIGFVVWENAVEALRNSDTPREISVDQVNGQEISQNYVRITGFFVPVPLYTSSDNGSLEKSWAPLLDGSRKRAILVQRRGTIPEGKPRVATLTGILKPLDFDLITKLSTDKSMLESIQIEKLYMLIDGASPSNPRIAVVATMLTFIPLACFGFVVFKRNTVFQVSDRAFVPSLPVDAPQPIQVQASGRFVLNARNRKRFIGVPALLTMGYRPQ